MNGLNEFHRTLEKLASIVGHDIIRNNGLSVILYLIRAVSSDEMVNIATMSEQTGINSVSLKRYIQILTKARVVEIYHDDAGDLGQTRICLTKKTREQVSRLFIKA